MSHVRRVRLLFLLACALPAGCGAASRHPELASRPTAERPAGPPRACIVRGRSVTLDDLVIAEPGTLDEVTLSAREVPAQAVLGPCAGTPPDRGPRISTSGEPPPTPMGAPSITLEAPVQATAVRGNVWMWLTADVTSTDGAVTANKGAAVFEACLKGDRVLASAILDPGEVEPGEAKPGTEYVSFVDVPCDALTLDRPAGHDDDGGAALPDGRYWQLAGDASQVGLHTAPEPGAPSHDLVTPGSQGGIYVRELEQRGTWLHVEAARGGVAVRGWVPASAFTAAGGPPGVSASCDCDAPAASGAIGAPESVRRTAIVAAGTTVYWRPPGPHARWTAVYGEAGARWGTFAAQTSVVVLDQPGAKAIQVASVPGLVPSPPSAPDLPLWLRRDDVRFAAPVP